MNLTFLIPVKIESQDRVRNLSTILCYLLSKFDAIVSIKECDYETKFESNIFPILIEKFGSVPKNLTYVFEKQKSKFFHKTKLLNDLLEKSNSEIVCNYDTDVLLPESSILNAYKMILETKYGKVVKDLYLVRLHPDSPDYELIQVHDLKNDIYPLLAKVEQKLN